MDKIRTINDTLGKLIDESEFPNKHLFKAARYSLMLPGKRLRPLLVLNVAEGFGVDESLALYPASAIEMIHTYSLIHDDLPCMDDDDLRRGKPTLHKVYDEGHAVLTGDYLLTYAFEVLADSPGLTDKQKIKLVKVLASRSGGHGMIGGQIVDLSLEGRKPDWNTLEFMHANKTAALISAALEFGGIIGNATGEELQALQECGHHLGIAFQIIDDILDVTSNEKTLGKPIASDIQNHKATSLSLMTLPDAKTKASQLLKAATDSLHKIKRPLPGVEALLSRCIQRTY